MVAVFPGIDCLNELFTSRTGQVLTAQVREPATAWHWRGGPVAVARGAIIA
jgi:hypothetical protein